LSEYCERSRPRIIKINKFSTLHLPLLLGGGTPLPTETERRKKIWNCYDFKLLHKSIVSSLALDIAPRSKSQGVRHRNAMLKTGKIATLKIAKKTLRSISPGKHRNAQNSQLNIVRNCSEHCAMIKITSQISYATLKNAQNLAL